MQKLNRRSSTLTALLLLTLNGCATEVKNFQACGTIPGIPTAEDPFPAPLGATCDDFLTSQPETLDRAGWFNRQASWNAAGYAVECMTSDTIGNIKAEIEKLCSRTPCDEDTKNAISDGLTRIQHLGKVPKKAEK